ncbi:alpha/beta hydrolase [Psychroserpens sp.]|uniref:alpha/beta hydrolase n=1 Tax=Psychroserpens sp. TaxID=2020870 RepID=UPI0038599240
MKSTETEISYTINNSYSTLNTLTNKTKHVWFVCHGMGYLSRYFINYFKELNPADNYIIAPQAQSKYYQGTKFKHVGASWLTKENTLVETENIMTYFDAIFENEKISKDKKLIIFGYSQGVSVAMRYLAKRKLKCHHLVLHSGGIPKELISKEFDYLSSKVTLIYGTQDEYLNEKRIAYETERAKLLFGNNLTILPFEGKHVVNVDLINSLV